jgi:hypothetical protein
VAEETDKDLTANPGERAARLLRKLDEECHHEPDEIAAKLHALRCKGKMGFPTACPLARYLQLSGFEDVQVGLHTASVGFYATELPEAVYQFRRRFDQREFPQLLEIR